MRNKPLPGFYKKKSPLKTDTRLADRIYRKDKVDATLRAKGEHTEGDLRGTKNTTPTAGANVGMGSQMINPNLV